MLRTLLIAISIIAAGTATPAQDVPEPVLFDRFGEIVCEDVHARTDRLASELANNPNSTAAIIISPGRGAAKGNARYKLIDSFLLRRRADTSRVVYFRGPDKESLDTAIWIVPPGAAMPAEAVTPWPVAKPDLTKPFIFGYSDDSDVCPTFVPSAFSDLIRANPGSRAHIVITAASRREARGYGRSLIDYFHGDLGLARTNVRLFYVIRPKIVGTETEYWFVPARR